MSQGPASLFPAARIHLKQRRQKIVLLLPQRRIERRSRRQHPRHLAPHNLLGELRVLHLIAEGDPVSLPQQPRQVLLDGVIGHAAHRHLAFPIARRQRQLQLAAGHHRIVIEQLVKIPHAKEEQRIGILPLRRRPLPHKRGPHGRVFVRGVGKRGPNGRVLVRGVDNRGPDGCLACRPRICGLVEWRQLCRTRFRARFIRCRRSQHKLIPRGIAGRAVAVASRRSRDIFQNPAPLRAELIFALTHSDLLHAGLRLSRQRPSAVAHPIAEIRADSLWAAQKKNGQPRARARTIRAVTLQAPKAPLHHRAPQCKNTNSQEGLIQ